MKFFDFFAGIGGFRLGMEMAGHECVGHPCVGDCDLCDEEEEDED